MSGEIEPNLFNRRDSFLPSYGELEEIEEIDVIHFYLRMEN